MEMVVVSFDGDSGVITDTVTVPLVAEAPLGIVLSQTYFCMLLTLASWYARVVEHAGNRDILLTSNIVRFRKYLVVLKVFINLFINM